MVLTVYYTAIPSKVDDKKVHTNLIGESRFDVVNGQRAPFIALSI
jgi:hypothetical protein